MSGTDHPSSLEAFEAREERREQRLRQLGTRSPRCSRPDCHESDPLALTGVHPDIVCYECQAIERGRSWLEDHHLAGRHNDPDLTVPVPGNDHRVLTAAQQDEWPRDTLRNPDGSPLLRAAASLRGWLDVLRVVIERAVGWVPRFLELLDSWLRRTVGPQWWEAFYAYLAEQLGADWARVVQAAP